MRREQIQDCEKVRAEGMALKEILDLTLGEEARRIGIALTMIKGKLGLAIRIEDQLLADSKQVRSMIEGALAERNAERQRGGEEPIDADVREVGKLTHDAGGESQR
jgi:hypothetical protein